jgi:hypothetical protein
MRMKTTNKYLFLTTVAIFLFAFAVLVPVVMGYGDSIATATTLSNGSHDDVLAVSDDSAFYKIDCVAGRDLDITVSYTDDDNDDLDLYLYDTTETEWSWTMESANPTSLSNFISIGGWYYLEIRRYSGSGAVSMTITISGAKGGISGFELMTVLMGLVFALYIASRLFGNRRARIS